MWASSGWVGTAVSPGVSRALHSVSCRAQGSVFPTPIKAQALAAPYPQPLAGMQIPPAQLQPKNPQPQPSKTSRIYSYKSEGGLVLVLRERLEAGRGKAG